VLFTQTVNIAGNLAPNIVSGQKIQNILMHVDRG
jgi:hypothetical protein